MDGLSLIEAAYEWNLPVAARIDLLLTAAARTLAPRAPVMAYEIAPMCDFRGVSPSTIAVARCDESFVRDCLAVGAVMSLRQRLAVYYALPGCLIAPEVFRGSRPLREATRRGVDKMMALLGTTGSGGGVAVGAFLPDVTAWPPAARAYWTDVATHLGSAWRLAARLDVLAGDAEPSSFRSDGTPHDLAAPAAEPRARAALQAAVRRREAVRSRRRSADAIALWPALIEGRWTLVDSVTASGQRYVIAHENPTTGGPLRALPPPERCVLELLLAGHSGKWIAVELGRSESWVARSLRAALRRLGARDFASLGALRTALAEPLGEGMPPELWVAPLRALGEALVLLTATERAVAVQLCAGRSTAAIARERGTSPRTVVNQISAIYRKVGVSSRRELQARFA